MRKPPKAAAEAVKRLSPLNLYGTPRFRLTWSEDPKTWACGRFREYDDSGNFIRERFERQQISKYPFTPPCWILEIWEPPEYFGSPEMWDKQTAQYDAGEWYHEIGPYPHEGDYRCLLRFIHKITHEPIEPSEKLIQFLFRERLKVPTKNDLLKERQAKEDLKVERRREAVSEAIGDIPFDGRPNNLNPRFFLDKIREDRLAKEAAR